MSRTCAPAGTVIEKSPYKESAHLFNGSMSNGVQVNRAVLTSFRYINWKYYPVTWSFGTYKVKC